MFEYGNENGKNYMVAELLGPTLNDMFLVCGGKFSLKTTLIIGMQIVKVGSCRSTDSRNSIISTICSVTSSRRTFLWVCMITLT